MQLSFEWLSDYLNLSDINAHELAEQMSRTGIEIESVHNYADEFTGLKVGYVQSCEPHPDSDHLHVTQVDLGQEAPLKIVCGAPNIQSDIKVIVAPVGSTLPGGLHIEATQLRGVISQGMICSLQELGFPDKVVAKAYQEGIYYLPEDAPIGADISDYLKLDDPILTLDLTPNRADALSVFGTVYEVAAITDQDIQTLETQWPAPSQETELLNTISLKNIPQELAPHFTLRVIENVKVCESPLWLQVRLMKMGMRPINNVVDVTNYVMLLFGQPLHAYDYDKLPGKQFSVRLAKVQEQLQTLDEVVRELSDEDMVITVDDQVVGLAGVMGGLSTQVNEDTQTIVLESARFESTAVRKTAKRHDLRSESSIRNEKGLNLETVNQAAEYASHLMADLTQGQVITGYHEVQSIQLDNHYILTSQDSIARYLGITLSIEEIEKTLQRLHFDYEWQGKQIHVEIPHRRWDVVIEADLMEEIARIYGYDHLSAELPQAPSQGKLTYRQRLLRHIRIMMESQGLSQVQTYVLTSQAKAENVFGKEEAIVNLALPMSEERTSLRQSLFHSLLEVAQYNMARQQSSIAIYETGRVFVGKKDQTLPKESEHLAVLLSGQGYKSEWFQNSGHYDYFDLKGIFENFTDFLQVTDEMKLKVEGNLSAMHPGRTARIFWNDKELGVMGQIRPQVAKAYDLPVETLFLEIDLEVFFHEKEKTLTHKETNKFPSSSRDIAMLVSKDVTHDSIEDVIKTHAGEYLTNLHLFDRYQGEHIDPAMQSLAYQLTFQNPQATITDEVVNHAMEAVTQALQDILKVEIR